MLQIQVEGSEQVSRILQRIAEALNPVQVADEAAAILLSRNRQRFLAQVAPDGTPWVPSFAARRRASSGGGGGTLYDTGRLFNSIQLASIGAASRMISTDVPYAEHAFDGPPVRAFLGASDDDFSVMTDLIITRIQEALNG